MFCIKFNSHNKIKLKERISLIFNIINILPTEEKTDIYMSEYTFAKVPESKCFSFIQNTILNNESILKEENMNNFITIIITLKDKKRIQIELTPSKVRVNKTFIPHIEFSFCNEESNLFQYFKETRKIEKLIKVLKDYDSDIDEAYFYDPMNSLNCYSDISNRIWQKRNNSKTFARDLGRILDIENSSSEIEKATDLNLVYNFVDILYKPNGLAKMNNLVRQSKLEASLSSGSLILSGNDVSEMMILLKEKLKEYIISIKKKNIYQREFDKVFS